MATNINRSDASDVLCTHRVSIPVYRNPKVAAPRETAHFSVD